MKRLRLFCFLLLLAGLFSITTIAQDDSLDNLHVPSPEWEDQIIYFIMIDRFNDGDATNNDQGMDEYDPDDDRKYSGGDLQGIIDQLDYIEGLGATTIWITPPVANQWWDPVVAFGGYHGYWAENFKEVDAHFDTLDTYKALSNDLHNRGMYLIQDIVANHTGNFYTYRQDNGTETYDPANPLEGFNLNPGSVPVTAPSQSPFDMNDATDPDDFAAAIYNWTPTIQDFNDPSQQLTYQLSDLDDLNTTNPVVRDALRDSYGYWINEVGVDGFRIDTVIYVEHDFWNDFNYSEDPDAPGMNIVAANTGRDDFLTFGEAFIGSEPYDDAGDVRVASYLGTEDKPELSSVLNFPLHFTINRVFAEGMPTAQMTYRLGVTQELYDNPGILPVFVDNHDVARLLSKANMEAMEQSLMFILTVPGIPVIYYGTEQAFDVGRGSMFAEGAHSGGVDHFDTDAHLYKWIQTLTELRKSNAALRRGTVTVLADDASGPGVLAYRRDYEDESALVIFNTADRPVLVSQMETGLPGGTVLHVLASMAEREDLVVGADGNLFIELGPREGIILDVTDEVMAVDGGAAEIAIDTEIEGQTFSEDVTVSGTVSEPGAVVHLVLNNNLTTATEVTAADDGTWEAVLPISRLAPGTSTNTVYAYAPELQAASDSYTFTAEIEASSAGMTVTDYDYIGDDVGPFDNYELPTDETFGDQLDILSTTVTAEGPNLIVSVEMADVTMSWNPTNGFDHVLFHIFVDVPGVDGATVLPRINANAPEGFAWDYMAFMEGWSTRLYSAQGSSATEYGNVVTPAPEISVDRDANTITFTFAPEALGNPQTLDGTQVYITTWDWNGPESNYRALRPDPSQWGFEGGDGAVDPLILDDTNVIVLKEGAYLSAGDAVGDDTGPARLYELPTDETFGDQLDILNATVTPIGTGLEVAVKMAEVTTSWNPTNGFDHVLFQIYVDVPGVDGATVLPRINANAPEGFAWDYMAFMEGWSTRLYSADGSSATEYGNVVTPAPEISVDKANSIITFTFAPEALGNPQSLDGVKVYITTWDWNGPESAYRALRPDPSQWGFSGGDGAVDPLIADDILIGQPAVYVPPLPPSPTVDVTFTLVSVPENTPDDATFYIVGPFNQMDPGGGRNALKLRPNDEGLPSITLTFDIDDTIEYRFTRGNWPTAEKLNPDDRFAVRELTITPDNANIDVTIDGWWDD